MVRPDGEVVGVVFAKSAVHDNLGFALTSTEVRPELQKAEAGSRADNGPCAAE
jgi:hypothetical protein